MSLEHKCLRLRVKKAAKEKLLHESSFPPLRSAYNTTKAIHRDPLRETITMINKIAHALGVPATQLLENYELSDSED